MTDHHSPTLRDASAPDSVTATPALPAPDGAWFRRERERIAVGRRAIAQKLQVAESRVVALETRRQPVPGPWLPLLVALGFRLPSASAESAALTSDLEPTIALPPAAALSAALSGEPRPSAAAAAPAECVAAAAVALLSDAAVAPLSDAAVAPLPAAAVALLSDAAAVSASEPPAEPPAENVRPSEPTAAAAHAADFMQSADLIAAAPAASVSPSTAPPAAESFLPGEPAPAAPTSPDAAPLPTARPADTARPSDAPLHHHLSVDGTWLQAERERVGMSRNSLRQLLNIQWASYAKIERQKLPVPQRWWRKLREVGFRFPGKPAPARAPSVSAPARAPSVPAQAPAAPTKLQGGLRGTWLRRQRQRLGLSEQDLWKALQVHWRTLTSVERHNRLIPAAWLPALERLGMTAAGRPEAASEPRPRRAPAVSPPAAPAAPPPAVAPAEPDGDDVLSMIVKYRLALGRRSRQSAVEIMALIAHDLRTADLSQAITHDQLAAAMQSLLRSRSSAA